MQEHFAVRDTLSVALSRAQELTTDGFGIVGFGVVELRDEYGVIKELQPFANLITTSGDAYYAQKAIVSIAPANNSAPTAASGMKLGTGSTSAAKSGTGSALITYLSGSNSAFDATFPQATAVGGDGGWNATYRATWGAGTATSANINEVVIVTDAGVNTTSSAANTYARATLSTVNKAAGDTLAITWSHKFLGA